MSASAATPAHPLRGASDPVAASPGARAAWLHTGTATAVVLLTAFLLPAGPWRVAAEVVVFALGLGAVRCALAVHRTSAVLAWWGLGAGLACFALSSAAETLELAGIAPGSSGTLEAALDVAAYAALVLAAIGHLVTGRRRDRDTWIDTATLLLAAALLVLAVTSSARELGTDVELGIGTPLLTAVVLLVCLPLALPGNGRAVSGSALLVAGALTVVGYGGGLVAGAAADLPFLDELPLLSVAALVLSGRHPSVRTFGRVGAQPGTAGRVVGLGAALLVTPALLVLWALQHGGATYGLGAGATLLTALALWRLAALDRERERIRAALVAGETRVQLLLENAADVIAIVGADGAISYLSPAVRSLLGRPAEDYLGRNAIELADPRDQGRLRAVIAAAGDARDSATGFVDTDLRLQHSAGGTRWVEMRVSGRVSAAGIDGWVVNLREVTDRKLFEDELRRQASTDALTGLLNRSAFADRLAAATATIDPAAPPAVLFVDLDDFKTVNDSLGHAAGDELLRAVGARLSADLRADDVVARLGGDEFAVLLGTADASRAREVADRILAGLRRPVELTDGTVTVTASVGAALATPGCTAERLLHTADTAMYRAKHAGKDDRAVLDTTPTPA